MTLNLKALKTLHKKPLLNSLPIWVNPGIKLFMCLKSVLSPKNKSKIMPSLKIKMISLWENPFILKMENSLMKTLSLWINWWILTILMLPLLTIKSPKNIVHFGQINNYQTVSMISFMKEDPI